MRAASASAGGRCQRVRRPRERPGLRRRARSGRRRERRQSGAKSGGGRGPAKLQHEPHQQLKWLQRRRGRPTPSRGDAHQAPRHRPVPLPPLPSRHKPVARKQGCPAALPVNVPRHALPVHRGGEPQRVQPWPSALHSRQIQSTDFSFLSSSESFTPPGPLSDDNMLYS